MTFRPDDVRAANLPPAVVLQLDCMTGLQTARILARKGVRVIGVVEDPTHYACKSRLVSCVVQGDPSQLVDTLNGIAGSVDGPCFVVPCSDRYVAALIAGRTEISKAMRFVQPDAELARMLMDKARFAEFAEGAGIPIPFTRLVNREVTLDPGSLQFPVVVKPALRTPGWDAEMGGKVVVVEDEDELDRVVGRGLRMCDELIVQEWVRGGDDQLISFNGYFDRSGALRASFTARKVRQWPPSAGTSASGEEVRADDTLDLAIRLFTEIGYRGLAYLETKRDPATGTPKVIEPNIGRPTGRSAIAEAGGVELVYTAYRDALDLEPLAPTTQRYEGVKWVYLRHDVQSALAAIRNGTLTVREWIRSLRGRKAYAVWAPDDPAPFLWDLWDAARRTVQRFQRRLRRSADR